MEKDNLISKLLKQRCDNSVGVLSPMILCQSVGVLNPHDPVTVREDTTLDEVIDILKKKKTGSVIVVNKQKITGVFTERDVVLKVINEGFNLKETEVSEVMTKNPQTIAMTDSLAYALNLMSHGGFRHLPITGDEGEAVGMLSVKDIVDFIASKMTESLSL